MGEPKKSVPGAETIRILEILYKEAVFLFRETFVVAAKFRRDSLVLGISAFPTAGGVFTYLTLVNSPFYSAILTLVSASVLVVAGSAIIGICLDIRLKTEIDWGYRLNMVGNTTLEDYYREVWASSQAKAKGVGRWKTYLGQLPTMRRCLPKSSRDLYLWQRRADWL